MSGKAHPLVYVLTVLVALNLAATLWLAFTTQQHAKIESAGGKELPTILTSSAREQIFEAYRTHYNDRNYDAIFDGFDELAKVQLNREEIVNIFEQLHNSWGDITEGAYSHHKYLGVQAGREWFDLFYLLKVTGGKLGMKNTRLKITVFYVGKNFGVMRFSMGEF